MITTSKSSANRLSISRLLGFVLCACAPAYAANQAPVMTIYEDLAGANELLAGHPEQAAMILLRTRGGNTIEAKILRTNNLCVARTLAGQLTLAQAACDNAVHQAARTQNYGDWFMRYASSQAQREYLSRALTNRSIMRALAGDAAGAAKDKARAAKLDPQI